MPHTDHQQNETNPTGGRDLGQITLQTFSIQELIVLAKSVARTNAKKHIANLDENSRDFFIHLVAVTGSHYGETTGAALANALGFDHIYKD